ncbi:hypothetical protein NMQ03_05930 [Arthrobacter sp. DNA4]|uniref:hypothetical protein n=1 Tax=Micrococcaceae TaxID=1268 RepID=UPI0020CBAA82|nr:MULTISPECIES: hypothetical protein [Micrococcaceae]UTT70675.1 hypothetical protein NMQ03_05930 [Arthrobacter sp. DNA4]WRT15091.1 hypothetical protein VIK36_06235 [Pseudarthrobacter sp. LT1]
MARSSSPWHALRPVLLAGAAAATWLTLSSTAATADAGTDSTSLLGGVTSSVSSLSHDLAATVSPVPAASTTGPAESPGLLQPVVTPVAGLADDLIAAVPVVDQLVPAGTVSEVSAPLVELADTVAAGVAQEVAAPAAETVPVLEPVLQPVSDLLTGAAPLPVPPLDAVQVDVPTEAVPAPAQDQPAAVEDAPDGMVTAPESDQAVESSSASPAAHNGTSMEPSGAGILAHTAAPQFEVSATAGSVAEQPLPDPLPLPAQAPAAPASGTGSGGSSGGTSPAAAWFNPFYFDFDRAGSVRADRSPEHAPAPVSFDPGSSPD